MCSSGHYGSGTAFSSLGGQKTVAVAGRWRQREGVGNKGCYTPSHTTTKLVEADTLNQLQSLEVELVLKIGVMNQLLLKKELPHCVGGGIAPFGWKAKART